MTERRGHGGGLLAVQAAAGPGTAASRRCRQRAKQARQAPGPSFFRPSAMGLHFRTAVTCYRLLFRNRRRVSNGSECRRRRGEDSAHGNPKRRQVAARMQLVAPPSGSLVWGLACVALLRTKSGVATGNPETRFCRRPPVPWRSVRKAAGFRRRVPACSGNPACRGGCRAGRVPARQYPLTKELNSSGFSRRS